MDAMYRENLRTCLCRSGGFERFGVTPHFFGALLLAVLIFGSSPGARAQASAADLAAGLQSQRIALQSQLRASAFGEPLLLTSRDGSNQLEGEVHAEMAHPFADVAAAFKSAATVCELLFLHLNVRACHPASTMEGEALTLTIGPKRAQDSDLRHHLRYAMRVEAATPAYLRVTLNAARGPLGTQDYRIVVEAVPVDAHRTFVRLGYAYRTGALARIAMEAYLATAGRAKIGFTVTGLDEAGRPVRVTGERAALERNVIRYVLALMAYSSTQAGTPQERMEARLRAWFALTERYAAQLHELRLEEYLQEKHNDLASLVLSPS